MKMSLEKWQEHLESHFENLARMRSGSGFPIFALEHGLSDEDVEELSNLLRSRLAAGLPLRTHWLAWVVYAAEEGYSYTGEEYWSSFECNTPHWNFDHRNLVRKWFKKFQNSYNGFVPSGKWANHFRIIAGPITHAILPRYLQRHFARTLYDLRFRLVRLSSIEPITIGRMIAASVYPGSSRFEKFLQQEELVGRIVLALFDKDPRAGEEPLLPSTLNRMVKDLEGVRDARDWLKETNRIVKDRFVGLASGSGPHQNRAGTTSGGQRPKPEADIKPSLFFRFTRDASWRLVVDIPSFKGIATLKAEIRDFLRQTRCSLNGGGGMKPAGWLMSSNGIAALTSWPDPGKPLVHFEQHQEDVDRLLADDCRITRGPIWLFRIGGDGIAREIAGRSVRPGSDYIIARKDAIVVLLDGMNVCPVDCDGIRAIRISVPENVPSEYINWLNKLSLDLARTVRVWPAGLPARKWDGHGRSEWLTTEEPCVGIVHDHPVDRYVVNFNQKSSIVVSAGTVGQPKFVHLPKLNAGTYQLNVQAKKDIAKAGTGSKPEHEGFLEICVREPEPWIPGTTTHAGLIVSGVPHDASLGTFWENKYPLSVSGPENRSVSATVILEDRKGEQIFCKQIFDSVKLPILNRNWKDRFAEFKKRNDCSWSHLEASAGVLKINGQELGEFSIKFEHEALPLRWAHRSEKSREIVRLVDDSGQEDCEIQCLQFDMNEPLKARHLKIDDWLAESEVQSPGGLFVAQSAEFKDCIVVGPSDRSGGFAEKFGVTAKYGKVHKAPHALAETFRLLDYWQNARPTGIVSAIKREKIVNGMLNAIVDALCGDRWARAETEYIACLAALGTKKKPAEKKERAQKKLLGEFGKPRSKCRSFGSALFHKAATIPSSTGAVIDWYFEIADRYDICKTRDLCAFAIAFANNPHQLLKFFPDNFEGMLKRLEDFPLLLRGARFAALLCANHNGPVEAFTPRWEE